MWFVHGFCDSRARYRFYRSSDPPRLQRGTRAITSHEILERALGTILKSCFPCAILSILAWRGPRMNTHYVLRARRSAPFVNDPTKPQIYQSRLCHLGTEGA
jgi:hypothetical protein